MGEFDLTGDETFHVRRPEGDAGADTFPTTTGAVAALASGDDGGGGAAGSAIVRKFPFAFDTPNLLTGATLYTPTVGDFLLDAWVEIDTPWDGTPPIGDIGAFVGTNQGWFNIIANANQSVTRAPVDMSVLDNTGWLGTLLSGNTINSLSGAQMLTNAGSGGALSTGFTTPIERVTLNTANTKPFSASDRFIPAKFATADPIKVVVTQDGLNDGADPGSTQGAAVLYLCTVTPV